MFGRIRKKDLLDRIEALELDTSFVRQRAEVLRTGLGRERSERIRDIAKVEALAKKTSK